MDYSAIKERMRGVWMAGDFGQIARRSERAAEEFVSRLPITMAMPVLDIACGTGNLAIPAARRGAVVTGIDIAPNLLTQARERAEAERLHVHFHEGDAESLEFSDRRFDIVMSMFGSMFAPRPELVAMESMRVCRSGGLVAMANWTPESFTGEMFRLTSQYVPPPEGVPAPVLWGKEEIVRERLGGMASQIDMTRRPIVFDFPQPPREAVMFFREYFGPLRTAFARLEPAEAEAFMEELTQLWTDRNEGTPERTYIQNEYLEVMAVKGSAATPTEQ